MEQERKRYSTLAKAIVLGVQMIASVLLAVSVVLLANCVNRNILNMGDLENSSFVESGYFERTFSRQMGQLLDYLQLKEQFETDGVYDERLPGVQEASAEHLEAYKKYHNKYDENSTNLYYWLGKDQGTCISNMDGILAEEDAYKRAVQFGRYVSYDMTSFRFETNIGGIERDYYENMARYNALAAGHTVLIVAVDENFTRQDDLAVARREFDKLYPWAKRSLALIIAGGTVWLFGLCYMSVAAGKRSEDRKVHLFSFDRIRTEIPIGMLFVSLIFLVFLASEIHKQEYEVMGQMVVAGTVTLLADICFMGLYLSLVRRVKADTFFENSYCNWLIVSLKNTLHSRYLGSHAALMICGIIAADLIVAHLAFASGYLWAVILLFVFLVFTILYFCQRMIQRRKILEGIDRITRGELEYQLNLEEFQGDELLLAEGINHIREGLANAIGERVRDERMKANLITNVSHDIKTPLTSIINYIGLLRREEICNPTASAYIEVLEQKAFRLKQLMEDLVEVSRISSGNVTLQMSDIDLVELVRQTGGEFNEKLEQKGLHVITKFPRGAVVICADGRQLWRVIGNLYSNVAKYAMADTRVYVEVEQKDGKASFSIKNISEAVPEVEVDTLTERFVRGDESRSSEGSGLGLSISKMLTERMGGEFRIEVDDDVFRAKVTFPCERT